MLTEKPSSLSSSRMSWLCWNDSYEERPVNTTLRILFFPSPSHNLRSMYYDDGFFLFSDKENDIPLFLPPFFYSRINRDVLEKFWLTSLVDVAGLA